MDSMYERLGTKADVNQRLMFIMGGGATKRFHTAPTLKENTVAQHSFGVAWLCWLLTGGKCSVSLVMAALAHDLSEQVWGDIPSPAKRLLGIRDTVTDHESKLMMDNGAHFAISQEEKRVLKLADYLDGMLTCVQERRLGNRNVDMIYGRYRSYLLELEMGNCERQVVEGVQQLWEESLRG